MPADNEYIKSWKALRRIDQLRAELSGTRYLGKYGAARQKRAQQELQTLENYLTPPAERGAIFWQRRVLEAAWAAFRANQHITFRDLLDHAMQVRSVPCEERVRRFLNRMGFLGKSGRPKKQ
ncbi:hypothetical protein [Ralstonia solanacearum]|uniref:hypothetical protein n=1 Tax=Ralstonia solanacearum TaxID=305 RepID=UPI0018D179E4|nr:hypothetical protein [Ralstonia solanacearum]